jgi:hypothetical protein
LDSAYSWGGPKSGTATFWAFRAFRDFDGKGGRFQDVSLNTSEGGEVSLFASRDESSTKLVAVLVNRDPLVAATVRITLDGCAEARSYRVFRFVAGASGLVSQPPGPVDHNRISDVLPPYSLTVLDVLTE